METEVNVKTSEQPKPVVKRFKKNPVERFPWQRMALSLLGIAVVVGNWRWAVYHMYVLPPHAMSGFVSITNNAFYVVGALVVFFVTGRLIYEWKNQTITEVKEQASHIFERKEEKKDITITEKVDQRIVDQFAEKYKNDSSYRPIDTVADLNVGDFR